MPANIAFFLSGHIHQFEYVNFVNNTNFAPQLVVGTGAGQPGLHVVPGRHRPDPGA